ncbi:Uncharacterised protein [Anaerobiospirillum thomasii]|nr:Uncharacterised protein [Anaerobiospirillum thomasii]
MVKAMEKLYEAIVCREYRRRAKASNMSNEVEPNLVEI